MQLIAFTIEGYRRFVDKTSVKLHGDLIALVGPNEAGKTSLLRAMSLLNDRSPFASNERPRRCDVQPHLVWHFQLDAGDREIISHIRDTPDLHRIAVHKTSDGRRRWTFEPRTPQRDRSLRTSTVVAMREMRRFESLQVADDDDGHTFSLDHFDRICELLSADVENYDANHLTDLESLGSQLVLVDFSRLEFDPPEDTDDANAEPEVAARKWREARDALVDALERIHQAEEDPSPAHQVIAALEPRLPEIHLFGPDDRSLASEYDLRDVAEDPPRALLHLVDLAGLDLVALREEADGRRIADVATRRNAANDRLKGAFEKSWNQQGIAIQLEVQEHILHIVATTPEDSGLSPIEERSDGMRWFAALLAYAHGWEGQPVLLVDEIEQHLHYDAQSDLIEVLNRQEFTSKVIFTTHSIGCLPHDLGTGVRVVAPVDAARSRIENGFWNQGSGFSPLLASMGAAAMSFTPTRHAVIAEGASDAVLLPTLMREVFGGPLRFQVAPGLSSIASATVKDLEAEAGQVVFLADGDEGGLAVTTGHVVPGVVVLVVRG